jgi:hypothetical protein
MLNEFGLMKLDLRRLINKEWSIELLLKHKTISKTHFEILTMYTFFFFLLIKHLNILIVIILLYGKFIEFEKIIRITTKTNSIGAQIFVYSFDFHISPTVT